MTAADRTEWSDARRDFFSRGLNRSSISAIDSAAFVLVLDDYSYDYDELNKEDESSLKRIGKILMHGRGNDRWFDKSFCVIVNQNGRIGCNVEHAW